MRIVLSSGSTVDSAAGSARFAMSGPGTTVEYVEARAWAPASPTTAETCDPTAFTP
jgi:hypothetical protein